jgi:hypothetical protein
MKKSCEFCGIEFEDKSINQRRRCCGDLCRQRLYRKEHRDQRRTSIQKWRKVHPESVKISNERRALKRKKSLRSPLSTEEKKKRARKSHDNYISSNIERVRAYQKQYRNNNKHRIAEQKRRWIRDRYTHDIQFKLRTIIRSRFKVAIHNNTKSGKAVELLGCSIMEFKTYIEAKFESWMNWDNWGRYDIDRMTWHIDHIVPLASFDLSDPEQLKKACHYTNLQPLLAYDNLSKGKTL